MPTSTEPTELPERRRGLRVFVALLVILLAVGLVSAFMALRRPDTTTGAPPQTTTVLVSTTPTTLTTEPTPDEPPPDEPTPAEAPAGFVDCTKSLREGAYCAEEDECYGSIGVYGEGLIAGVEADCEQTHIYQTFAAGHLGYNVARQETLENDALVKQLCTIEVVNRMLRRKDRRDNWEVYALGPQNDGEDYFRCIFGRGTRGTPIKLVPPD